MGNDGDDTEARDRAAILARRQRFIALALSGLAAACGDESTTSPMPCLDVAPQTESSTVTGPTETGSTTGSTSGQSPCLGAVPDTSSSSGPLESTTSTGTDSGESTETGDTGDATSSGDDGSSGSSGGPLPCLSPPR